MRRFHSYGPVDCEEHFCVPRTELVDGCVRQLVDNPEKGGHFFTIWAPRQTGKTWLMRQARDEIARRYPDRFLLGTLSMQGLIMGADDPDEVFFDFVPRLFRAGLSMEVSPPNSWNQWADLFSKGKGAFSKPAILFIDEFDSLPPRILDQLVTLFRDIYLSRDNYHLHGLALIGVRAVLGVESLRGSPFNIQRSLHVPNLTPEETTELFRQYQEESGQTVEPEVVAAVQGATQGQPGLVSWFGELLTETYNPGTKNLIRRDDWKRVYSRALHSEWNNTVLNLVKKVRARYQEHVLALFGRSDVPFRLDVDWCAYLYLNGVIDKELAPANHGDFMEVCRFSCPFIQERLYHALTYDLIGDGLPILPLDPLDDLENVFSGPDLDIPALLNRYKDYLARLKTAGIDPWKDQPRRSDLRLTEAVGHFHLFAWLQQALGRRCSINPEFPTGNGRVDLHLRCKELKGLIEVKSFRDRAEIAHAKVQAAGYARLLGFSAVAIALFVPVTDETILSRLSEVDTMDGVRATVVAIGWT
ncbi:MAG: hypothetical protein ACLFRG_20375 [Desulfococcaceae bacterium]